MTHQRFLIRILFQRSRSRSPVQRDQAGPAVRRNVEGGVLHVERTEQAFLKKLRERLSGGHLDHTPQGIDSHQPAVTPLGAGLEVQRNRAEPGGEIGQSVCLRPALE
ncbi:MAG: hypothetical protein IT161_10205 [Bryobacterales bacterium]|nr:hypothetical protein [Bryobacterales bacterium]